MSIKNLSLTIKSGVNISNIYLYQFIINENIR